MIYGIVRRCLEFALLFAIAATAAFGQINTAAIVGSVSDQSGAMIPDASIILENVATQARRTTASDATGSYSFQVLPVGAYRMMVEAPGFKRAERAGIRLEASDYPRINIVLELGEVSESVTVTEGISLVNTQKVEGGTVILNQQVVDMPLNGRDFSQLIQLEPGAVFNSGRVFFNGLTSDGVNISIDGTDANQPDRPSTNYTGSFGGTSQLSILSIEFIEEFKTTNGVFSAEVGRAAAGGVNIITKSGTNELHGSVFEFLRNDHLDARNFFASRKDSLRINQYGVAVGGPIVRNRIFFFGGWEGARVRRGVQIFGNVPTVSMREQMLQTTPAYGHRVVGPVGEAPSMLDLLPLPNVPGGNEFLGSHRRSESRTEDQDVFLARLDFHISDNDTVSVRYNIMDSENFIPDISPINGTVYPPQDRYGTLSWSHLFGATMLNELRLGVVKTDLPRRQQAFIDGTQSPGAIQGVFSHDRQELLQANGGSVTFADNLSVSKGAHSLKFGVEDREFHYGRWNFENPHYRFNNVQQVIAGTPESVFITVGNPLRRYESSQWGAYIQDDWRIRPNLTLNIGLRYEYYSPPDETIGGYMWNVVDSPFGAFAPQGTRPWEPDRNDFGPRFGLAWDINGDAKTVVRAGIGVFYAPNTFRELTILGNPPELPYDVTVFRTAFPNLSYPTNILDGSFDPRNVPGGVSRQTFDRFQRTTYSEQWTLNVQREIVRDLAFEVGYVGNRGLKILATHFFNEIEPELPGPEFQRAPELGRISYQEHSANSTFHSLQASLKKRMSRDFMFNAHYTWGHGVSYGGIDQGTAFGNAQMQNMQDWAGSRGRSAFDIRHNFTLNFAWDMAFDRWLGADSGFARKLLNGWQFNTIVSMRTGTPIRIQSGRDNRGNNDTGPQRPDYVGGEVLLDNYRESLRYLNRDAFAQPCAARGLTAPCGLFGNFGTNAVSAPGTQVFDLSLFKTTQITERVRLQFRTEMFNAFNRANFSSPSGSRVQITDSQFGAITAAGLAREIQFGLKLLF
ncbi:MAG: TonB-dependent receptor [Bryobacterales bacterium]